MFVQMIMVITDGMIDKMHCSFSSSLIPPFSWSLTEKRKGMSDLRSETQAESDPRYVVIIVMGVSGVGKTTLATALAREWNMEFVEGDELHPKSNIEKISSGRPLNDQDREPWLERIRETIEQRTIQRPVCGQQEVKRECNGLVITCSALKKSYRELLRGRRKSLREGTSPPENTNPGARKNAESVAMYFVYVKGLKELILPRMQKRNGHYMKPNMLDSQFEDLESPEGEGGVVVVDAEDDTRIQVDGTKEKIKAIAGDWFLKCF